MCNLIHTQSEHVCNSVQQLLHMTEVFRVQYSNYSGLKLTHENMTNLCTLQSLSQEIMETLGDRGDSDSDSEEGDDLDPLDGNDVDPLNGSEFPEDPASLEGNIPLDQIEGF